jgi:hypothetical protein
MSSPRIVASNERFRIVRIEDGNRIAHVIEVPDGADALGVERWREYKAESAGVRALRDFILELAAKEQ